MGARWPLVLVLVVALAGSSVFAVPAMTSHPNPCTKVAATDGSDVPGEGDGSVNNPYGTVGKLVTQLTSGQTGCLRGYAEDGEPSNAGLYDEALVTILNSNITLRSYPHEVAQIKGRMQIVGANVTISHLVLDGRNASGFQNPRMSHLADGARLVDNVITTRSTAGCAWADGTTNDKLEDVEIVHNRIHDCKGAVTLEDVDRALVADNLIYDNKNEGVRLWPGVDNSTVTRNVIDRSSNSVVIGTGSESTQITSNALSNPNSFNLKFSGAPDTGNKVEGNCMWKTGGDPAIDPSHVGAIQLNGNVTANPGYLGATAEADYRVPSSSGCHGTTGSMDAAVSDNANARPHREQAVNLRPNILFIVTDDQRADTVDVDTMPNTLKWFREGNPTDGSYGAIRGGTRYTAAFATTPLCCPSRASIFTGRFAHNHNVWLNQNGHLLDSTTMLPAYLKRPGLNYYNAMYGKYLNAWSGCPGAGGKQHDDVPGLGLGIPPNFDDYSVYQDAYRYFSAREPNAPDPNGCSNKDQSDPPEEQHTTSYTFHKATSFLQARESNDAQPWFLYLAPFAPHQHGDESGPNAWQAMTEGTGFGNAQVRDYRVPAEPGPGYNLDKPYTDRGPGPLQYSSDTALIVDSENSLQKQQLRALKYVDSKLENVMATLETMGEADDTLAFFVSDNGYLWREHGKQGQQLPEEQGGGDCVPPSPAPGNPRCGLKAKGKPYLEAINIPFLVRWPDNPNVEANHDDFYSPVATIDLAATALDAVDWAPPEDVPIDGRSVLAPSQRVWMFNEYHAGGQRWYSLVNGVQHFIAHDLINGYDANGADTSPNWVQAYNLQTDREEQESLYGPMGQPGGPGEPPVWGYVDSIEQYKSCKGVTCP